MTHIDGAAERLRKEARRAHHAACAETVLAREHPDATSIHAALAHSTLAAYYQARIEWEHEHGREEQLMGASICPGCGCTDPGHAPGCPLLGNPTREELDAIALREHIAAHPTPPSGPPPMLTVEESVTPAKTTRFYKPDGSMLMDLTFGPVHHIVKTWRFPKRDSDG